MGILKHDQISVSNFKISTLTLNHCFWLGFGDHCVVSIVTTSSCYCYFI